jgi:hypothetical protein
MSVAQPEGSVGHEWEADRHLRCGLVLGVVNAASHLWQASLGLGAGSLK